MPDQSEAGSAEPAVRLMMILGGVAVVVLAVAALVFAISFPSGSTRSAPRAIRFYQYDPATGRVLDTPTTTFRQGQIPAAVVELDELDEVPSGPARASWYDSVGYRVNRVDFPDSGRLGAEPVPLSTTSAVPAGTYQFVVEMIFEDEAAKVIAWVHLEIES